MKARIKATGEIAEVQVLGLYVTDRAQALYGVDEVEIIPIITELSTSIDWEQREWEASVAIMQGYIAANGLSFNESRAAYCVKCSQSLIEEFKKQQKV